MSTQPEALRLADELDWRHQDMAVCPERDASAELRRLHAENEAAHAVGIRQERELMECEAQRDELLEALKLITEVGDRAATEIARAAIAKATGEAA